jgi:hypothetical protein
VKIEPVSGDLLLKLAIGAAIVGAAVYAARQAAASFSNVPARWWNTATDTAASALNAVNPLNNGNVFATGANNVVSTVTGRPETLGGWLYSATHADPMAQPAPPPVFAEPTYDAMGNRTN